MSSPYGPDDPSEVPNPERDPDLDGPLVPVEPTEDPDAQPEQE
jgi:hypothetical protein